MNTTKNVSNLKTCILLISYGKKNDRNIVIMYAKITEK